MMCLKVRYNRYRDLKNWSILVIFLCLNIKPISAQTETSKEKKSQNFQQYTPSILLNTGQWELKSFHNIYTQTSNFTEGGRTKLAENRSSYYTGINQFLIGVGNNINVGFDFWYKAVTIDAIASHPFKVFEFRESANSRFSPIYFGPKIKVAPFKKISRLSLELTALLPIGKDFEGRSLTTDQRDLFLEPDRTLIIHSFYYDHRWSSKFQLFARASQWVSFPRNSYAENPYLETPFSAFVTFFPNSKWSIYTQQEAWLRHIGESFSSGFFQSGLGVKYQLIEGHLELEGLWTKFVYGSLQEGAGHTINFGIRYLR